MYEFELKWSTFTCLNDMENKYPMTRNDYYCLQNHTIFHINLEVHRISQSKNEILSIHYSIDVTSGVTLVQKIEFKFEQNMDKTDYKTQK